MDPEEAALEEVLSARIRLASPSDALAVAAVQVAGWNAAYRGLLPEETLAAFTVPVREATWRRILAEAVAEQPTMVCERAGRVVGFVSVGPSRTEAGAGEVWALYAHPAAWGSGVGRALLGEGLAFLAGRGWGRVMLWVLPGNARAVRFYEVSGFRCEGEAVEMEGIPHLRMTRILNPDPASPADPARLPSPGV